MKQSKAIWPKLALLMVGLIWGTSNVFIKSAVNQIPASFLIALRCSISSCFLAIIFWKKVRKIMLPELTGGVVIGVCLFLAYYMQTCSMYFTDPGKCGFLAAIYSVIVPFLYWAVSRRRPAVKHVAAAFLCISGVVLCSVTRKQTIAWGDSMALISGFFYAAHIVAIDKLGQGKDPIIMTILQFFFAAIIAWVVALTTEASRIVLPTTAVFDVLYLAMVCTGVAMLLQNIGQDKVEPNLASVLMSTESVFGVLISVIMGYERLNGKTIVGFMFIFLAILVAELDLEGQRKKYSTGL